MVDTRFSERKRLAIQRLASTASPRAAEVEPRGSGAYTAALLRAPAGSGNEIIVEYRARMLPSSNPRKRSAGNFDGRTFSGNELVLDLLSEPSDVELKPKNIKSRITVVRKKKSASSAFSFGQTVEVTSDEIGFEGSWYTAIIVNSLRNDKYLVEYQTLLTDDETRPLLQETSLTYIRPCPPQLPEGRFKLLDKVDVWYNEGWWEGVISRTLTDQKYAVYFSTTKEELMFTKFKLRLHQDWVDGKWVLASKNRPNDLVMEAGYAKVFYRKGMKVEIKSNEDMYKDSWYGAIILDAIGDGKYSVKYQTLTKDGDFELLKEEVADTHIRPCPPDVQRCYRFGRLEIVDAWYNDGWWMGYVSQILDDWNYQVYFVSRDEELVFNHSELRSHQDWIRGQWLPASKDHIAI